MAVIKIKIYEFYNNLYASINKDCAICFLYKDICLSNSYVHNKQVKEIPLYEFILASKYKNERNTIKKISNDIRNHCKDCRFYHNCKTIEEGLINYKETNKIIKELKELIKNNSEID